MRKALLSVFQDIIAHDCRHLVQLFNEAFIPSERTCLQMGAPEPEYQPADQPDQLHCIRFTRDYFASALHEVAHWCVAGVRRRQLPDYGYWYRPDGRNREEQALFERVEVQPQALEWLFAVAAGYRFRASADNLALGEGPSEAFKDAIHQRVLALCAAGVNARAERFLRALMTYYGTASSLDDLLRPERFDRGSL